MVEKGVALATSLYRYLTASGRELQRQARRGARHGNRQSKRWGGYPIPGSAEMVQAEAEYFISHFARLRPDQVAMEIVTCGGVRRAMGEEEAV